MGKGSRYQPTPGSRIDNAIALLVSTKDDVGEALEELNEVRAIPPVREALERLHSETRRAIKALEALKQLPHELETAPATVARSGMIYARPPKSRHTPAPPKRGHTKPSRSRKEARR